MKSSATMDLIQVDPKKLHVHPLNPRRRMDPEALAELRASVKERGVLTPLLVRPHEKNGLEVLCGSRRLRAALEEGLATVPVLLRRLNDEQALEVMLIDNLQRADVHPLEEADGFRRLLKQEGATVATVATRIGRSERYVYDRLKLLELVPRARKLWEEGRFETGHAVLLARLSPADQERCLGSDGVVGGLFRSTLGMLFDSDTKDPYAHLAPVSTRELRAWIDQHVRLDTNDVVPLLFPAAAKVVQAAPDEKETFVPITQLYQLPAGTKDADGARTYTPNTWRRAKVRCAETVTGLVVVGPGRGETFPVCVDKKRCKVHWGKEIREAQKAAKSVAVGKTTRQKAEEEQRERYEKERQAQEAAREAWTAALPKILEALAGVVNKAPAGARAPLARMVADCLGEKRAPKGMQPGRTAEDAVRYFGWLVLAASAREWSAHQSFPKIAKQFGLDVRKLLAAKPEKP